MNVKRSYSSETRSASAELTRQKILDAARTAFAEVGIEAATMRDIAKAAGVAEVTVYKSLGSKEGILRALMRTALFGPHYQAALVKLSTETDPVQLIARTPDVACAIWTAELQELKGVRDVSGLSPSLRAIEAEFEALRLGLQRPRIELLYAQGRNLPGLGMEEAARLLWMYTSRDIWRMLVIDGGWSGDAYRAWLFRTLMDALVAPKHRLAAPALSGHA